MHVGVSRVAWGCVGVCGRVCRPISESCGQLGALCLGAAICQLTLGRHSNQNALQRVQSVPPQVELSECCHQSTLPYLFPVFSPTFYNTATHSSPCCLFIHLSFLFSPFHPSAFLGISSGQKPNRKDWISVTLIATLLVITKPNCRAVVLSCRQCLYFLAGPSHCVWSLSWQSAYCGGQSSRLNVPFYPRSVPGRSFPPSCFLLANGRTVDLIRAMLMAEGSSSNQTVWQAKRPVAVEVTS